MLIMDEFILQPIIQQYNDMQSQVSRLTPNVT